MPSKKTKAVVESSPNFPLSNAIWENLSALADEGRSEVHKQANALITLADGAVQGATKFATSLNQRVDSLGQLGIQGADKGGRKLALTALKASEKVLNSYRNNATQLVSSTRDGARSFCDESFNIEYGQMLSVPTD